MVDPRIDACFLFKEEGCVLEKNLPKCSCSSSLERCYRGSDLKNPQDHQFRTPSLTQTEPLLSPLIMKSAQNFADMQHSTVYFAEDLSRHTEYSYNVNKLTFFLVTLSMRYS